MGCRPEAQDGMKECYISTRCLDQNKITLQPVIYSTPHTRFQEPVPRRPWERSPRRPSSPPSPATLRRRKSSVGTRGHPPGTSALAPGEYSCETSPSPVGVVFPLPHGRCDRRIDGTGTEGKDIGRLNSGNRSLAMSRRRLQRTLVE